MNSPAFNVVHIAMKKLLQVLIFVFIAGSVSADTPMPLDAFPKSTLQIATPDARIHRFNVWLALDDAHRQQGLMFVKDLPANTGMLFIYPSPRRVAMWMKNTYIPLDMVFVRADGKVSSVVANTKPHSLANVEAVEDVVAVLELRGGTAASLNIGKGAVLMHEFFQKKR